MGGIELDLSELAVLRPIQTAASGGGGAATPPRRGNDGLAAADTTGCVTPTAVSSLLPRPGAFGVGVSLDVIEAVFSTPTSSPCLLRAATVCPPAPRKPPRSPPAAPAGAKRKRCCDLPGTMSFFPVPQDLSTVFVPRGAADRSPPPQPPPRAAKKIRRLFVVG